MFLKKCLVTRPFALVPEFELLVQYKHGRAEAGSRAPIRPERIVERVTVAKKWCWS